MQPCIGPYNKTKKKFQESKEKGEGEREGSKDVWPKVNSFGWLSSVFDSTCWPNSHSNLSAAIELGPPLKREGKEVTKEIPN